MINVGFFNRKGDIMKWILLATLLVLLYYRAHKNTYHPKTNHIDLKLRQKTNPINILHLSDFHMEKISISPESLYTSLKDNEIDIIALTGDYLERFKNVNKFVDYLNVLNQLNPKYGIYVVFGNHDYLLRKQIDRFQKVIEDTGAIVLRNENRVINIDGQKVNIIGIDDFKTKRSDLEKSYEGITDGINLVLTHDPNVVIHMKDYYYDYLLCGHFHGGQIHWPKPYHLVKMGELARENVIKGLNFYYDKPFYISEGLGQTALNIRLRSRPEITLHNLS